MKKTNILGKYSDNKSQHTKPVQLRSKKPEIVEYQQRYKGKSLSARVTEPQKPMTLDEKIKSREALPEINETVDEENEKVSVEIAGNHYLLGCTEGMSPKRIMRIAHMADSIINETTANNPGLTNSRALMLSLINACDRLISVSDEKDTLKVDLLFLRQQEELNKSKNPVEPTPMEKLASRKESDENNGKN